MFFFAKQKKQGLSDVKKKLKYFVWKIKSKEKNDRRKSARSNDERGGRKCKKVGKALWFWCGGRNESGDGKGGKGGGGRADFAQAGGTEISKIDDAFDKIKSLI